MDPESDLFHEEPERGSGMRKREPRMVSREVALPNSSRRAAARAARKAVGDREREHRESSSAARRPGGGRSKRAPRHDSREKRRHDRGHRPRRRDRSRGSDADSGADSEGFGAAPPDGGRDRRHGRPEGESSHRHRGKERERRGHGGGPRHSPQPHSRRAEKDGSEYESHRDDEDVAEDESESELEYNEGTNYGDSGEKKMEPVYSGSDNYNSDEFARGDAASRRGHSSRRGNDGRGRMETVAYDDASKRGNSPELNPMHASGRGGRKADMADGGGSVEESMDLWRKLSADPPTAHELRHGMADQDSRPSTPPNMDPIDDGKSLLTRLDAPPTPEGPEKNKRSQIIGVGAGNSGGDACVYTNYMLDEEGRRQYELTQRQHGMQADLSDGVSRMTVRGQDPPDGERGCDPGQIGSASINHSSSSKYRGSRTSRGKGRVRKEDAPSGRREREKKKVAKKKQPPPQPEIKGILKKRGAPIPITQFGKPVNFGADDDSFVSSGSDPDMTEQKSLASAPAQLGGANDDDTKSIGTQKSGLRSGKYASLNAAAAAKQDVGGSDEHSDSDQTGGDQTDDGEDGRETSEDDENTLKSIVDNGDERFDRSQSHFLRTADLGLTQDTIFAEQFLDDPNTKPEPHYHHPSPHPPPGVQFHIDENWVCLDDGKGGHSPIAPQAVDALVAMGYRAACDPMMWTPTSKTRKYMTEKGLRFDDIPIPGPMDEGDGGAGDSSCLIWSGKFPHKYHGHEQPAVRSQGIVNMSPEDLVDLLLDSRRVSEYNKSSIGREDMLVLSDGTDLDSCPFSGQRKKKLTGVVMSGAKIIDGTAVLDSETDDEQTDEEEEIIEFDDEGNKSVRTHTTSSSRRQKSLFVGVTKLARTKNKLPLVHKVLEFFTLLHCRALTDEQGGDGYIIVGRGVTPASKEEKGGKGVKHSEILLNVHIIRRLRVKKRRGKEKGGKASRSSKTVSTSGRKAGKSDLASRSLMINVNHLKSPMVPNMLAKKVGLSAAVSFISDIRALTD